MTLCVWNGLKKSLVYEQGRLEFSHGLPLTNGIDLMRLSITLGVVGTLTMSKALPTHPFTFTRRLIDQSRYTNRTKRTLAITRMSPNSTVLP